MKRILQLIFFLAIVWCLVCVGRPYWDRYWLGNDMEAVAIYGTKNTIAHTKAFLTRKMKMAGRDFEAEDFTIEKDKNNRTTISITYEDEIIIFGQVVKTLRFKVEKTKKEVAAML
jgi:hypothetical protein